MLVNQIKRLHQQGYRQRTIVAKLGCCKSHVSQTLSKKKCRKRNYRITPLEYKLVKSLRNV